MALRCFVNYKDRLSDDFTKEFRLRNGLAYSTDAKQE